jgi:hypothetical protein
MFRVIRLVRACQWTIAIFLFGGAAISLVYWNATGRHLSQFPREIEWLVWVVLLLIIVYMGLKAATALGRLHSFEGYCNRDDLEWARGSIESELKRATESIWIYWDNGTALQNFQVLENRAVTQKIKKMIIMGESNPALEEILRLDPSRSKDSFRELIRITTIRALDAGIDIRQLERSVRLPPMILVDHRSHWGWIRFEAAWPGMAAKDRPTIVIKKRQSKLLFKSVKRSYDAIFRSLPPLKD